MKLIEAVNNKKKGVIRKAAHYFPIYDFYFEKNQHQPLSLLEIGIGWGGSLFTWAEYFPKAHITGIDIKPKCKQFEQGNIKVFVGDQADAEFLKSVNKQTGPYDIVIDDGGHTMHLQIISFQTLFPLLKDDGYYIIEDWQTSYLPKYRDGGPRTVDMLKELIDGLNIGVAPSAQPSYFSQNIVSLHFYNGIIFIRKGKNQKMSMLCQ